MAGEDAAEARTQTGVATAETFSGPKRLNLVGLIRPPLTLLIFLLMIVPVVHDRFGPNEGDITVGGYEFTLNEWMYVFALLLIGLYLIKPLVRSPAAVKEVLIRFAQNRFAAVFGFLSVIFFLLATIGPFLIELPEPDFIQRFQPPVGATIETYLIGDCIGPVDDTTCHGSLAYPLGTEGSGRGLLAYLVYAFRTSFFVGLTATVIAVFIGATLGIVAGYYGGIIESSVLRIIEFMHALPAFFIYALLVALTLEAAGDLVIMTLVFGLLSWGGVARMVYSSVLQRKEEEYIQSAIAAGASSMYIIRRHIVPNVMTPIVMAATLLVPLFMLFEAALSFLELGDPNPVVISLGDEIRGAFGVGLEPDGMQIVGFIDVWWTWVFPSVLLIMLLLSMVITGDALREALDPRVRE